MSHCRIFWRRCRCGFEGEFRAELAVAIPSLIEQLGDKNAGLRASAVSVAKSLALYGEAIFISHVNVTDADMKTSFVLN